MANYGDFRGAFDKIISLLKGIDKGVNCATCANNVTSAGINGSVAEGFKSVSIIKTSSGGTATITLSDGSTYNMTVLGESFSDAATANGKLPAYEVTTLDGATWKWHGIK